MTFKGIKKMTPYMKGVKKGYYSHKGLKKGYHYVKNIAGALRTQQPGSHQYFNHKKKSRRLGE